MAAPHKEDPWWFVAVAALIVLLALDVVIPVSLIAPVFRFPGRVADLPNDVLEPPAGPPARIWVAALGLVLAVGLAALAIWKTYDERELNSRWTWMSVAAGIAVLWAVVMLRMTLALAAAVAGA